MRRLALALLHTYFSAPPVDAPELAWRGSDSVGVGTLDLYLEGDETRRSYIHVPVEKSNDGVWPAADWTGFQRRWAMGLEIHCAAAQ